MHDPARFKTNLDPQSGCTFSIYVTSHDLSLNPSSEIRIVGQDAGAVLSGMGAIVGSWLAVKNAESLGV
jgi:hypothetical protein